jgi:hypothetical protein
MYVMPPAGTARPGTEAGGVQSSHGGTGNPAPHMASSSQVPPPAPFTVYTVAKPPKKDAGGNYSLYGSDRWVIDSDSSYTGNVTLHDKSVLEIKKCRATFNGTFWGKNHTTVSITDANLTLNICSLPPVNKSHQYDNPNGFLLMEDYTKLKTERSYIRLFRNDTYVPNPHGFERVEQVYILFGDVSFRNTTIDGNGIVMRFGNPFTVERGGTMHGNSNFSVYRSKMAGFITYVNAHGVVEGSDIYSIAVNENTGNRNVFVRNSTLKALSVQWESIAELYNTMVKTSVSVKDNSRLYLLGNTRIVDTIPSIDSFANGTALLYVSDSSFRDSLSLEDSATVVFENSSMASSESCYIHHRGSMYLDNDSWIALVNCYDRSSLIITNASIENLKARNDATIRLKNATITLPSNYQSCLYDNATLYIDTVFIVVTAKVNGRLMPLYMECYDYRGELIASTITTKPVQFAVTKQIYTRADIIINPHCTINVHRGMLSYSRKVELAAISERVTIKIDLMDEAPPEIRQVGFEKLDLAGSSALLVSATVSDAGIGVSGAVLQYSTDSGANWSEQPMYYLGNDTYEYTIAGLKAGTTVQFRVFAEDFCLNNATSANITCSFPQLMPAIGWSLLVISVVMVAVMLALAARKHRVKRRYLKRK